MAGICPRCHNTGTEEYWDDETEQYKERDCTACIDPWEDESGREDVWEADMAPRTGMDGPTDMVGEGAMNDKPMNENMMTGKCDECGADWDGDSEACSVCGAAMLGDSGSDEEPRNCEVCGAPGGEPCDPGCPNAPYEDPLELDPDRAWDERGDRADDEAHFGREDRQFDESTDFDKFMDRTLLDEGKRKMVDKPEDNPQRRRALGHQNRPLDRTRIGRTK
jgi:hypothetical protein